MTSLIRNARDLLLGLLLFGVGAGALYVSANYRLGTARAMGPGYFPTLLGYGLIVVSILLILRAFVGPPRPMDAFALRPALAVLGGALIFGMLLRSMGLIIAILGLVFVSKLSEEKIEFRITLAVAALLATGSWLIFVVGLGQPIPVLPGFLMSGRY